MASPARPAARLGIAALALAGAAAALVGTGGVRSHPGSPPLAAPPPTVRAPFSFRLTRVVPVAVVELKRPAYPVARAVADRARSTLSHLYDSAFLNPQTRGPALPVPALGAFAPNLVHSAQAHASAFTLGQVAGKVAALDVTVSQLVVRVLLDGGGHGLVVVAQVEFKAAGQLSTGEILTVTNRARYILRPQSGRWVIVGYPLARTEVTAEPAPPTPSPGPTASGATPAPSATGAGP